MNPLNKTLRLDGVQSDACSLTLHHPHHIMHATNLGSLGLALSAKLYPVYLINILSSLTKCI